MAASGIGTGEIYAAIAGTGTAECAVTLTYTDETRAFTQITSTGYNGAVTLERGFTDGAIVYAAGALSDPSVIAGRTIVRISRSILTTSTAKEASRS